MSKLKAYYDNLPKTLSPKTMFIDRVAARTGVTVLTVRLWIKGNFKTNNPDYLRVLSKETGIPENELFND